jgi:hypothetical protein
MVGYCAWPISLGIVGADSGDRLRKRWLWRQRHGCVTECISSAWRDDVWWLVLTVWLVTQCVASGCFTLGTGCFTLGVARTKFVCESFDILAIRIPFTRMWTIWTTWSGL